MINKSNTPGSKLIDDIKSGKIKRDIPPNNDEYIDPGYYDLLLYKFKIYLGSVGRYIMNKRLKESDNY